MNEIFTKLHPDRISIDIVDINPVNPAEIDKMVNRILIHKFVPARPVAFSQITVCKLHKLFFVIIVPWPRQIHGPDG
jgi:hypothetical protein